MRELVTPREAARLLGVTRRKLNQLAKEGRLKPVDTVGLHKRFRRMEVEDLARDLWGGAQPPDSGEDSQVLMAKRSAVAPTTEEAPEHLDREPVESGYLTAPEAAQILGVNPKTVNRWADQGKIPGFKTPGGQRRFAVEAIHQVRAAMLTPQDLEPGAAARLPELPADEVPQGSGLPGSVNEPLPAEQSVDPVAGLPTIRVPERLRKKPRKDRRRPGLPDSAWRASGISDASAEGHRRAGPTQLYGDDT